MSYNRKNMVVQMQRQGHDTDMMFSAVCLLRFYIYTLFIVPQAHPVKTV